MRRRARDGDEGDTRRDAHLVPALCDHHATGTGRNTVNNRLIVTHYDAWAPPTDEPCSSEDYAVTMLALYAIAATVAVIGVTLWAIVRGRGR